MGTNRGGASAGPAALLVTALVAAGCGGASDAPASGSGEPVTGGTLVYGLSADVPDFSPLTAAFAGQHHLLARTILEPLTALDAAGDWQPYLAESVTPNDDATEWTIVLREGIAFSNGEPLTADVVVANIEAHRESPVTGLATQPIDSVTATDELTTVVTLHQPWSAFPSVLSQQFGLMLPTAALEDPELASQHPIGTGPFQFEEHVRDSSFTVVRNPDYWRAEEGLPYLDRIEFRILPDAQTALQTLESGGVDVLSTADGDAMDRFREDGGYRVTASEGSIVPTTALALNTAVPPTDDVRVRQALALATDRQGYIDIALDALAEPAAGPWPPGSAWHTDGGYPGYDLAAAQRLVAEYEAEHGPVEVRLVNVPDPAESTGLLIDMWEDAGITVELETVDAAGHLERAFAGDFNVTSWSPPTFDHDDPDVLYFQFHSAFVAPVGEFSLNIARIADDELDAAFDAGRATLDEAERRRAYATVQERLGELVPWLWVAHTSAAVINTGAVHGVGDGTLPGGGTEHGPRGGNPPYTFLGGVWLDQ